MGESATTILTAAWTEITNAVSQLMANNYTALMITLPIAGTVIGIAKGMFRGRRR